MQIARDVAGFSMAQADILRKAVGKKIAKLLAEQKVKFIEGCVKNGLTVKLAEEIFSFIEPFAGYGFNRSHAACYAMISYQTAYLKANYPAEFMAALLTSDQQDTDRIAIEIEECRNMGIEIQQPDINQSFDNFTVVTAGTMANEPAAGQESRTIRFGLKAIKNLGEHIAEEIIKERKANGPFRNPTELLERIDDKDLNRKSLESLVKSGALDSLGERGQLLANLEPMIAFHKETTARKLNRQVSLFASADADSRQEIKLSPAPPATQREKLAWEKELLGLYITEHPFTEYKPIVSSCATPMAELVEAMANRELVVGGVVSTVKKILTRKNETMLFVKLEDGGNIEAIVFPKLLAENPLLWQEGKVLLCQGTLSDKDGQLKLLANRAVELTPENASIAVRDFSKTAPARAKAYAKPSPVSYRQASAPPPPPASSGGLRILIPQDKLSAELFGQLQSVLQEYPGPEKVFFVIATSAGERLIETEARVAKAPPLLDRLKAQLSGIAQVM